MLTVVVVGGVGVTDPSLQSSPEDSGEPLVLPPMGSLPYLDKGVINTQGADLYMTFEQTLGWTAVFFRDGDAVSPPAWYVAQHPDCWVQVAAGFTAAEIMSGTAPDQDTARALAVLRGYDLGGDDDPSPSPA